MLWADAWWEILSQGYVSSSAQWVHAPPTVLPASLFFMEGDRGTYAMVDPLDLDCPCQPLARCHAESSRRANLSAMLPDVQCCRTKTVLVSLIRSLLQPILHIVISTVPLPLHTEFSAEHANESSPLLVIYCAPVSQVAP